MKNIGLKISIITPSYNQRSFIKGTIEGVLENSYENIEYIISDGGSSDGSVDIIEKYSNELFWWKSEKDNGQADAIRKGFEQATGDIFAWLNSDDMYVDGAIERVAEAFGKDDADVVYGNEVLIDENDNVIGKRPQLVFPKGALGTAFLIYGGFQVLQPAAFWKRELYEKVGGMDTSYKFAMDPDLFIRFSLAGAKFKYINEDIVKFRVHSGSKTANQQHVRREERLKQRDKYGMKVPAVLRCRIVLKFLGFLWLLMHLRYGRFRFFLSECFSRLGRKSKNKNIPY